jgi:hypothetical protein
MRQRLSWNLDKVAEQMKKADPYTMNQEHANNPVEKYHTGDPDAWAETPDMKTPWKNEGRDETGHPAPAHEAVKAARMLEDKALKCITIAQRMLPGAVDAAIEEQATDLMYLPERSILATLQRQASLAETLACKDEEDDDAAASKKDDDDATAAKKNDDKEEIEAKKKDEEEIEAKKKDEEEVEAKKKDETTPPPAKKEDIEAKKKVEEEDVEAKKKDEEEVEAKKKDEEEVEAKKKEEEVEAKKKDEEEDVEASIDFLDQFFAKEEVKTGAKKLSGIVKQASVSGVSELSNLWDAPPDVSKNFK